MKKTLFGFNKKDVYTSDRSVWPPTPSCLWRSRELHTGHHLIGLAKRTAVGGVARDTAVGQLRGAFSLFHFCMRLHNGPNTVGQIAAASRRSCSPLTRARAKLNSKCGEDFCFFNSHVPSLLLIFDTCP